MTITRHIADTLETSYYVVRSRACMPSSCWGRYDHIAIIRTPIGAPAPKSIKSTKSAVIVEDSGPQFDGRSTRCAAEKAECAAIDTARNYATSRLNRERAERAAGYEASLAERTDEI